jgi:hypothetical protein
MTRRSRLWWFRLPWPWKVADVLNRLGWCWSDLVDWALAHDRRHPEWPIDEKRLAWVGRKSVCARRAADPSVTNTGRCYCGQAGPDAERERSGGAL